MSLSELVAGASVALWCIGNLQPGSAAEDSGWGRLCGSAPSPHTLITWVYCAPHLHTHCPHCSLSLVLVSSPSHQHPHPTASPQAPRWSMLARTPAAASCPRASVQATASTPTGAWCRSSQQHAVRVCVGGGGAQGAGFRGCCCCCDTADVGPFWGPCRPLHYSGCD